MHYDPIENTLEQYEMLVERLTKLIRDGLAESQVNKEKYSHNYLIGKSTAYAEILGAITTDLQKIQKEWEQKN